VVSRFADFVFNGDVKLLSLVKKMQINILE